MSSANQSLKQQFLLGTGLIFVAQVGLCLSHWWALVPLLVTPLFHYWLIKGRIHHFNLRFALLAASVIVTARWQGMGLMGALLLTQSWVLLYLWMMLFYRALQFSLPSLGVFLPFMVQNALIMSGLILMVTLVGQVQLGAPMLAGVALLFLGLMLMILNRAKILDHLTQHE